MTSFSATDAAFEGFRFTRERPGAVASWAAVILLFNLASSALGALVGGSALVDFEKLVQASPLDSAAVMGVLPRLLPMLLATLLITLASNAIVYPSALRSFMGIDQKVRFRFGEDERRTFLVLMALIAINFLVSVGVAVLLGIIASVFSSISNGLGQFAVSLIPPASFLISLAVMVRLSLALVIAVDRQRIDLKESWASTRGHFWAITGSLVLSLVLFAVIMMVTVILMGVLKGLLTLGSGGAINLVGAEADQSTLAGVLAPSVIFFQTGLAIITAMLLPVILGPLVRAYAAYDNFPAR